MRWAIGILLPLIFGVQGGSAFQYHQRNVSLVPPSIRIGQVEGEEPYLLGLVAGIAGDKQGRVFVSDMQLAHVQVYDSSGQHVQTVGRRGEGPGEMKRPSSLAFLGEGLLALYDLDLNAYQWFEKSGVSVARRPKPHRPHAFDWIRGDGYGRILDSRRALDSQDTSFFVVRVALTPTQELSIDSVEIRAIPKDVVALAAPEKDFRAGFVPVPMTPSTVWTSMGESVAYSVDGSYLIEVSGFETGADTLFVGPVGSGPKIPEWVREHFTSERVAVFEKHAKRAGVDPQRWVDQMVIPETFPDVLRLMSDPLGRMWVLTGDSSGRPKFDLWSADGDFIGSMVLETAVWPELDPMAVSGTHILCLFKDDLGVHQIVGFEIPSSLRG